MNSTFLTLIIFYAMFLSRMLLMPIKMISYRLSKLNENFLRPIGEREIPDEFKPLSNSINRLIERIQTFMLYQKELMKSGQSNTHVIMGLIHTDFVILTCSADVRSLMVLMLQLFPNSSNSFWMEKCRQSMVMESRVVISHI